MLKCPFCGYKYLDSSELEKHLLENHFISIRSYYEFYILNRFKALEDKYPLTYLIPDTLYIPDWDDITNVYERKQLTSTIGSAIEDFYNEVLSDRFLQMFLITNNYFDNTLLHTYTGFKEILKELPKQDRNKIWFLDWNTGYPKIISKNNLDGIKIISIDDRYDIENTKDSISINSWKVIFPEIIPFDQRHHSRYNIFNLSADTRNTKRLRLKNEKDQCIKFFNNDKDSNYKSLFKVVDHQGNNIINSLSVQDLTVTKLLLLRNKSFMKLIIQMVNELIKNINIYSDSVFLKNTITINQDKKNLKVHLSWLPEKEKNNFINISIL